MEKYLFHTLFRLSKEGIMTSCKSIAFFLLLSTQLLFGALNGTESTSSMQVHEAGTQKLVSYTDVPGLSPSDKYAIRVRSAATDNQWVPVFTHKNYNRQQELGWTSVPKVDGSITATGVKNYLFFTGAWSHSYGNIEMSPDMPVEVEVSAVAGFQILGQNFFKAAVYPPLKANPASVVNNKVYFTLNNPAQIVIDINGNMDDSNKALGGGEAVRHTVSLFANPIMVKPSLSDTANVVVVEPGGPRPSDDLGARTTLYFKPGVHNLGINFKIRPGKNYYIPGDALVYGTFNNIGVGGTGGGRPGGENIKLYGYGTISSQYLDHPDYVFGAVEDEYKSVLIYGAYNSEINGLCIADPAQHAASQVEWTFRPDNQAQVTFARWAKVISWRGNGDGFGSVHLMENCFLRTNDDASYIKGSKYKCTFWKDTSAGVFHMAGIPEIGTTFPIVIEDCDLIYSRGRSTGWGVFDQRGSGVPGQRFVNVTVRNFTVHDRLWNRTFFSLNSGPFGSSYSGLRFENITMPAIPAQLAADTLIKNKIGGRADAPWYGGLMFKNVTIGGVPLTRANFSNYFDVFDFADYFLFDEPRSLTLTTAASGNLGSVTRDRNQATYLEMTNVKLTPVPNVGLVFSHWTGAASGTANPLSVWMTDTKSITANFVPGNIVDPVEITPLTTGSWSVPPGVFSLTIEAWGGGGAGGSAYGGDASYASNRARAGGGAGGSYAVKEFRVVLPGDVITYSAGAGGSGALSFTNNSTGASGGVSFVKINGADVVSAVGGPGGKNISVENADVNGGGGIAPQSGNIGDRMFYGGSGSAGSGTSSAFSGAGSGSGGGSAGATGNGGNAPSPTTAGSAGSGGGAVGGRGVNNTGPGLPGGPPGAGGSGAIVRDSWYSIGRGGQGSDGKIKVQFNTKRHTLTQTPGNGTIATDPSIGPFIFGTSVPIRAIPNVGYAFDYWSGDLIGSVNPTTITMDGNKNVTANYKVAPTYTLTTTGANGTFTLNPPGGVYNLDTVVTVTAVPNSGYTFSHWTGALTGSVNPSNVTMSDALTVNGNFGPVGPKAWDGGGANSNWSTFDNWSNNFAPSGPNAIPFTFAGNANNTSNNDLSGLVASDFNFTNTGSVGNTSPFVLSGNLITLGGGRSVVTSTVTTGPTITDIINLDLRQVGTTTFNTGSFHNLTINGSISETTASGLTKIGNGTLTLSGNNTYTGTTTVSAGRLILGNNTAGNNGIISDSSNIILGSTGNNTVLQFHRADNTTYAGNITGSAAGLAFVEVTGNGNLTLSGNLGTSAIYLKKFATFGSGAVNLTGTNYISEGDYFGIDKSALNVTGGTTTKANGVFIGNNGTGTMSTMNISSSGQFIVANNTAIRVGAGGYDGTVTNGASDLTITGNALFDTATTTGTFQVGSSTAANTVGTGTINLNGGTLSTNRSISGGSVANSTFNFNGGTFKATGTTTTISLNATLGRVNVRNGGAKIDTNGNNISIAQALLHSNISGDLATDGGLTKMGTGTLTLSGANTYSGATTISAGTLKLGVNNCLPDTAVAIAAASLDVGTFSDTVGTLDVTDAATINVGSGGTLAFAASAGVDWTGGTLNVTGTFTPGSSIRFGTSAAGLTATQLGLISINGTPGASLDPSGFLIAASDPYLTWSGGVPFDGDANNDGVQDGLAWLLGAATPSVSARGLLPTIVESGESLQMTFSMRNPASRGASAVQLQHSSDFGTSDPWTSVLVPNTSGGPTSGITFVITPGSPFNGVQATISSSESAGGKLFGRLKGVK